jgi:sucrose-6-phosphate hydrolase SacC (GH32 family)
MPVDQLNQLSEEGGADRSTGDVQTVNQWLAASAASNGRTFQLVADIALGTAKEVGCRMLESEGEYTAIGYDRQRKSLFVDRTHSGLLNFNKDFPVRTEAPLSLADGVLRLTVLVDRNSVEVFADAGSVASTNLVFAPPGGRGIEFYEKGGASGEISAHITRLRSIWASPKQ